ncbi:hypothetical protein NQZ68_029416 [Dissostichus eleginoides]|nr:hypothetical protein NQZ68_029416 [Dissostichus eleginoides]
MQLGARADTSSPHPGIPEDSSQRVLGAVGLVKLSKHSCSVWKPDVESSRAERTVTEFQQGRSESASGRAHISSRTPLRTEVARDWQHAQTPVCWPRVTRGAHF